MSKKVMLVFMVLGLMGATYTHAIKTMPTVSVGDQVQTTSCSSEFYSNYYLETCNYDSSSSYIPDTKTCVIWYQCNMENGRRDQTKRIDVNIFDIKKLQNINGTLEIR